MKRISGMILVSILVFVSGTTCKDKREHSAGEGHEDHGEQILSSTTKIGHVDGMKVVVDLNTMEEHAKMMDMMGMPMKHDASSDHYVSVTLLDENTSDPVKDAKVSITVTPPKGKAVTKEAMVMSGKGMYHYGADFSMAEAGDWKVDVKVKSGDQAGEMSVTLPVK